MAPASLFVRLGGSPGISALVDDVVAAHLENHAIKARFLPYLALPDRLAVVKKHTCSFFEMGSGGPAAYTGRSMTDAHRGMNLSEAGVHGCDGRHPRRVEEARHERRDPEGRARHPVLAQG